MAQETKQYNENGDAPPSPLDELVRLGVMTKAEALKLAQLSTESGFPLDNVTHVDDSEGGPVTWIEFKPKNPADYRLIALTHSRNGFSLGEDDPKHPQDKDIQQFKGVLLKILEPPAEAVPVALPSQKMEPTKHSTPQVQNEPPHPKPTKAKLIPKNTVLPREPWGRNEWTAFILLGGVVASIFTTGVIAAISTLGNNSETPPKTPTHIPKNPTQQPSRIPPKRCIPAPDGYTVIPEGAELKRMTSEDGKTKTDLFCGLEQNLPTPSPTKTPDSVTVFRLATKLIFPRPPAVNSKIGQRQQQIPSI